VNEERAHLIAPCVARLRQSPSLIKYTRKALDGQVAEGYVAVADRSQLENGLINMNVLTRNPVVEIFGALANPFRLDIMSRIASVDELGCTTIEMDFPISKSTISYHMRILYRAGLLDIRKAGRYYFYSIRKNELDEHIPGLRSWLVSRI
jgi:DNA-binding transcriptional ArsR family regulator